MNITREVATKVLAVVDVGLVYGVGNPKPGEMCVEAAVCFALGLPHGDEPDCVDPVLRYLKINLNDKSWSSKEARARGLRRLALAQLGTAGHLDSTEFIRRVVDIALHKSCPQALRSAALLCNPEQKTALVDAAARCEREGTSAANDDAQDVIMAVNAASAPSTPAFYATCAAGAAARSVANAADAATYYTDDIRCVVVVDAVSAVANAANTAAHAAGGGIAADTAFDKSLAAYAEDLVQVLIEMEAPGCQWLDLAPFEQ